MPDSAPAFALSPISTGTVGTVTTRWFVPDDTVLVRVGAGATDRAGVSITTSTTTYRVEDVRHVRTAGRPDQAHVTLRRRTQAGKDAKLCRRSAGQLMAQVTLAQLDPIDEDVAGVITDALLDAAEQRLAHQPGQEPADQHATTQGGGELDVDSCSSTRVAKPANPAHRDVAGAACTACPAPAGVRCRPGCPASAGVEFVTLPEGHLDGVVCVAACGNQPYLDGFHPILTDGSYAGDGGDGGERWASEGKLVGCAHCGRVFSTAAVLDDGHHIQVLDRMPEPPTVPGDAPANRLRLLRTGYVELRVVQRDGAKPIEAVRFIGGTTDDEARTHLVQLIAVLATAPSDVLHTIRVCHRTHDGTQLNSRLIARAAVRGAGQPITTDHRRPTVDVNDPVLLPRPSSGERFWSILTLAQWLCVAPGEVDALLASPEDGHLVSPDLLGPRLHHTYRVFEQDSYEYADLGDCYLTDEAAERIAAGLPAGVLARRVVADPDLVTTLEATTVLALAEHIVRTADERQPVGR